LKRYAVANWKMNLPAEGMGAYLDALGGREGVIVAPPYPYLRDVAARIPTAGQNCADQRSGAFTGEVAPDMLRDCGASFAIVGHSERRRLYGETDDVIARKVDKAIAAGLTPIFCVGEEQLIRERGGAARFISNQIRAVAMALEGVNEIVVAYEPIWAIGTGRNATGATIAEMVNEIRGALDRFWPKHVAATAPVLYGGSVTPENIGEIGGQGRIAGYLVGGASLVSSKFLPIVDSLALLQPA
jgi:triosephosphate isomerase